MMQFWATCSPIAVQSPTPAGTWDGDESGVWDENGRSTFGSPSSVHGELGFVNMSPFTYTMKSAEGSNVSANTGVITSSLSWRR